MAKVAFVVPLDASRHIQYAVNLGPFVSTLVDVYVILTDEKDKEIWDSAPRPEGVTCLVLSNWVSKGVIQMVLAKRSMPTFKKWMAMDLILRLHEGAKRYRYFVACDSEIKLVKPIDQDFVDALPSQFNFVGDHLHEKSQSWNRVFTGINSMIPPARTQHPCERLYTWWSGLPVYAVETLGQFLRDMGAEDELKLATSLTFDVFDHMVYQRWVVARGLHGSRFVCFTHHLGARMGWSLEFNLKADAWEASRRAGLVSLWASRTVCSHSPWLVPGIYITYHLDH